MNPEEISYALTKQLASAYSVESNYGAIDLDEELRQALDAALRPILQRRLRGSMGVASQKIDAARDFEDGWKWMTHPTRFCGKPFPVRFFTERGQTYYQPFDWSGCDFRVEEMDEDWRIVAAQPGARDREAAC